MAEQFYIQFDGKVFFVEKGGCLAFPDSADTLPFSIERRKSFEIDGIVIYYCEPLIDKFPEEWMWREDALVSDRVDQRARKALAFVSPYIVGKAIITDGNRNVVVVKGARGGSKGKYTAPGGIVIYGEDSRTAAIRETKEECGLDIAIVKLLHIQEDTDVTGRQRVIFLYLCKPIGGTLQPNMDDVCEAFWTPLEKAMAHDYYAFRFLKDYLESGGQI